MAKLGGSLLDDAALRKSAIEAIASSWRRGGRLVLVHGGGKHIDAALRAAGIPKRTHDGLRITDLPTLAIVQSTLEGPVRQTLLVDLLAAGIPAAALSSSTGVIEAMIHPPIDGVDLGFVGKVVAVSASGIESVLSQGRMPLIASIAVGPAGLPLNVNADAVAAAVAAALGAKRLIFLTDVDGLLDGRGSLVESLAAREASALLSTGVVSGGMRPKLKACLEALGNGVQKAVIAGPNFHQAALAGLEGGTHLVAA